MLSQMNYFTKKHPSGKGGMRADTKTRIRSHDKSNHLTIQ